MVTIRKYPEKARIEVMVGDVVDLMDSEIVTTRGGEEFLRMTIRSETKTNSLDIFADKEICGKYIRGRITKIVKVAHYRRRSGNKYWNFTDAWVEMENAYGEEPTLVSECTYLHPFGEQVKTGGEADTPVFGFGSMSNGNKE